MLHREVPHNGLKRPPYPLLFCVKVSNYIAKMLLIEAKTRPFCSRKVTPFCLKLLRKRDCLSGHLESTHTGQILPRVSSIVDSVSPPFVVTIPKEGLAGGALTLTSQCRIREDYRVQFYSQCYTKRRIGWAPTC